MKKLFIIIACFGILASFGSENSNHLKTEKMNSIFELAINKHKAGQGEAFLDTRAKFVEILKKEKATLNDGKWKPFFTVDPNLKVEEVLVGITEWSSLQDFGEAAGRLLPQAPAKNYFATFDPLAYLAMEPIDGKPFDINGIQKAGQVVEFAVRKAKTEDAFTTKRDAFFSTLPNYDGFLFDREFKVYQFDESFQVSQPKDLQVVVIVWESVEKFQAAANPIFASQEYSDFASSIEVQTYFATMYDE